MLGLAKPVPAPPELSAAELIGMFLVVISLDPERTSFELVVKVSFTSIEMQRGFFESLESKVS